MLGYSDYKAGHMAMSYCHMYKCKYVCIYIYNYIYNQSVMNYTVIISKVNIQSKFTV